jgi:serine/threonine protein kinase
MEGGTLGSAFKFHSFEDRQIGFVAREVLKGLEFLHYKDFVHRDVTVNSILS